MSFAARHPDHQLAFTEMNLTVTVTSEDPEEVKRLIEDVRGSLERGSNVNSLHPFWLVQYYKPGQVCAIWQKSLRVHAWHILIIPSALTITFSPCLIFFPFRPSLWRLLFSRTRSVHAIGFIELLGGCGVLGPKTPWKICKSPWWICKYRIHHMHVHIHSDNLHRPSEWSANEKSSSRGHLKRLWKNSAKVHCLQFRV